MAYIKKINPGINDIQLRGISYFRTPHAGIREGKDHLFAAACAGNLTSSFS